MAGNEVRILITATDTATKVVTGMQANVATAMKAVAASMLVAGAGAVALGKSVVQSASATEESLNKVRVVFKESSKAIEDMAQTSARSMGLSRQATLEAAGTFGNLFTSMGLTRERSSDMSQGILPLGADLASFNNIPVADALEKIRAGLVGEAEPLRSLGVNLNQAAIEAEAMRLGILKTGETMSAATKAQATYSLILAQTKNAQGDFARTSDGLANQQRILAATVENLQAKLGAMLLPVVNDIVRSMNNLLQQHGDAWAKQFANALDGLNRQASEAMRDLQAISDILGGLRTNYSIGIDIKALGDTWLIDALQTIIPFSRAAPALRNTIRAAGDNAAAQASGYVSSSGLSPSEWTALIEGRDPVMGLLNGMGPSMEDMLGMKGTSVLPSLTAAAENLKKSVGTARDALQELAERIADEHTSAIVEAFLRGGDAAVEVVRAEQKELDKTWVDLAKQMRTKLGIEIPDEFRLMWEGILDDQKKAAKALREQELELAKERIEITRRTIMDLARVTSFGADTEAGALQGWVDHARAQALAQAPGGIWGPPKETKVEVNISGIVGDPAAVGLMVGQAVNAAVQQNGPVFGSGAVQS